MATDLVWTDSMTEWKPAGSVPAVAKYLAGATLAAPPPAGYAAPQATVTPQGASVGYYNPAAGLPPRAAETLRGHAPPAGDVSDWPLDDHRVQQFREAFKLRQSILQSANLFKGLLALYSIAGVLVAIGGLAAMGMNSRSNGLGGAVLLGAAGLVVGLAIFFGFAWKVTIQSKRWASITATVLLSIMTAFSVVSSLLGASNNRGPAAASSAISVVIAAVIGGAFIAVSSRAIGAIPKYLQTPAWCQELLSKTKA